MLMNGGVGDNQMAMYKAQVIHIKKEILVKSKMRLAVGLAGNKTLQTHYRYACNV